MNVFGIGLPEMVVIAAIGLLVFGPKRLPELGKTLGRTLKGFQSASQEFEKELRAAVAAPPESAPGTAEPELPALEQPVLERLQAEPASPPPPHQELAAVATPQAVDGATPSQAVAVGGVPVAQASDALPGGAAPAAAEAPGG